MIDIKGVKMTYKSLGAAQRALPPMLAKLINYAYIHGYELTLGDAYRDPRVHGAFGESKPNSYSKKKSNHKRRLAIDLNLFRDGVYLTSSEAHRPLGEYWESLGGAWGGRFNDGNHYSIEYQGIK